MENAAEAFKMFLATAIFAIALTVFFRMTSLAKDTADVVFSAIDKTTLINYSADTDGANRTVTFQEIIPTIYRYAQEGYGVTIIDGSGQIAARFDLDTESQVSSCFWDDTLPNGRYARASDTEKKKSNSIKYEMAKYLNENILLGEFGLNSSHKMNLPTIVEENEKENFYNYTKLNNTIKMIYATEDNSVYTGWLKSNTYNNNYITQRISCDIYGGTTRFSLINPGVNETRDEYVSGTHKNMIHTAGLLGRYEAVTFTEYIVQIDNNDYIKVTDDAGNEENTGLLVFGTLRNAKKREIIYVSNEL